MRAAGFAEGELLTAIVAAMEEEVAPVRARLVGHHRVAGRGVDLTVGRLAGAPVALVVTGDGERNARRGAESLLAALPLRRMLVVGVAGGLSASLGVGELVICEHVLDEAGGALHGADRALVGLAETTGAGRRGVAITATRIADSADDKARLLALSAAPATSRGRSPALPAVVDLESAAFATVAARANVPWLVLRAVSDTSTESIPALLNRSRDAGGAVRRGRVVAGLLTSPLTLLPLLGLRGRVRTCAERLAAALEPTLAALRALDALAVLGSRSMPASETTATPKEV